MTGENPSSKGAHTIADHALGAGLDHAHAPGDEPDHDHETDGNLLAADSQVLARIELLSIGVDIGSSGTQVVFSRLHMYGPGEPAAMRRKVRTRETLYMSPVVLTPFAASDEIDIERLRGTMARAFKNAGLTPDQIDTGVIVMTGAAARRVNARAISQALSFEAGDIVTAAAGNSMEAALAAHGSGAVERARAGMQRILNIDIGGATTKFAMVENGRVVETAAMSVGGRHIAVDADGRLIRCDEEARTHARRCGFSWEHGNRVSRADMARVAQRMADDLFAALKPETMPGDTRAQFLTPPLETIACDGIMFSGGVAEYVYGRERRNFGDLGQLLGEAIAQRIAAGALPAPLLPPGECIRATVLGCSEYSVQMSGATCCITTPARLLPRRNLPTLQPAFDFSAAIDSAALARAIASHRRAFGDDDPAREIAFAFRWRGDGEHGRLLAFAHGLRDGLADRIAAGTNIYVLIEGDAALTLGALLRQELDVASDILIIDGIVLRDFDFIDIGRIRMPSGMIPVTVKTLQFGAPDR